jgi:uncharacterized membrane protein
MWFQISKIVHVIGNVLWLGGGAVVAFAYVMLASESASLAGGLTMLLGFWTELYAKAPWAHTKLTVGIIAAGFSGVLTGKLRRAAAGQEVAPGAIRNAGIVLLVSAVLGVVLVFTKLGQR